MPRTNLLLIVSIVAVTAGSLVFDYKSQAVAQSNPLLAFHAARRPAPPWKNNSWLNSDTPLTLEGLKGKVILLNFWVFTCYNCTNTVPSLVNFDRRYRDKGLVLIGIHTPEFPPYAGEHDKANVARALKQYGIEYPNAQDNDSRTWNLYGIRYWPSFVLIDKKGVIRYEGAGEFHLNDRNYDLWDQRIRELLAE
jgi:thiol-disulfide isomerase/thioredoxin